MRKRWISALVLTVATVAGVAAYTGTARATSPHGFSGVTLAKGTFDKIDSHIKTKVPQEWEEEIQTEGSSDLFVQDNTWQPGGSTGWHTHPGPSFVIVTEGSVTVYDGDDPTCTGHVFTVNTANNSFIDPGGGHVHIIRNETNLEAKTIAVQLTPHDAMRRIDAARPAQCPAGID